MRSQTKRGTGKTDERATNQTGFKGKEKVESLTLPKEKEDSVASTEPNYQTTSIIYLNITVIIFYYTLII